MIKYNNKYVVLIRNFIFYRIYLFLFLRGLGRRGKGEKNRIGWRGEGRHASPPLWSNVVSQVHPRNIMNMERENSRNRR